MKNRVEARSFDGHVVWARLLLVALFMAAFTVSMGVAADEAKAAPSEPVTRIFVDGDLEKKIVGEGTFRDRLSPGCHDVRVVQREDGEVTKRISRSFCGDQASFLRVNVSESGNVAISQSSR